MFLGQEKVSSRLIVDEDVDADVDVNNLMTFPGHSRDIRWRLQGHSVDILWTFCGHDVDILWTFHEHSVDIRWTLHGHSVDIRWIFGSLWGYFGVTLG